MDPIDTAVAATTDALVSALYTALKGTLSVAQLQPIVQTVLETTDYANVLSGYAAAAAVADTASAGGTPTPVQLDAYTTTKLSQNPYVHAAL